MRDGAGYGVYRVVGLFAGPAAAAAIFLAPAPAGLSVDGWWTAGIAAWMAIWWMTEAIPLAATALVPLAAFPVLGLRDVETTASAYAHPLIFLFLGGFLLARAMGAWGLDRRLALAAVSRVGAGRRAIVAGMMAVTAFLSMWVSNTATTMVMLPIATSVAAALAPPDADGKADGFAPALLLGIAYAATIGGMGTVIGTPPNAIFVAYMAKAHGIEVSFVRWMSVGVPMVVVLLPVAWLVLTRVTFRVAPGGRGPGAGVVGESLAALGPISRPERAVAVVLVVVAAGWMTRPLIEAGLPWLRLSDAGIAMIGALVLFVLPVDLRRGRFLLSWREAAGIRWDILILFGGGLSLAAAIGESGLAAWIGGSLAGVRGLSSVALLLLVGIVIVLLSELASNTAMAAVFMPVAGATAVAMGVPAIAFALPVALFATLGFMLPVGTPPNAIVYGSGAIEIGQMVRAGFILDILGVIAVAVVVTTVGRWLLTGG